MEINKIINNINDTLKKEEIKRNHNLYEFQRRKLYDILGEELVYLFKKAKVIIAGGCITSIFTGREINDIDTYFRDDYSLANTIDCLWEDYGISCNTKKAILLSNNVVKDKLIQLIHYKRYDNAYEIFDTFDFTCCMGAFDFKTETFVFDDRFFIDNTQKTLRFNSSTDYPLMSMLRVEKYKNKGYSISKSEFIRILLTCMNKKINTLDELKEQVGGMYGLNLTKLYEGVETKEDGTIDLMQVVDSLKDLYLNDDYFKESKNMKIEIETKWDLINSVIKDKFEMNYIRQDDSIYLIGFDTNIHEINEEDFDKDYKNIILKEISLKDYIGDTKYYKWVEKDGDELHSIYKPKFKYIVGENIKAKNTLGENLYTEEYYDGRIYVSKKTNIFKNGYFESNKDRIMLELTPINYHIDSFGDIVITEVSVDRIVPKEEYEKWNKIN